MVVKVRSAVKSDMAAVSEMIQVSFNELWANPLQIFKENSYLFRFLL